MLGTGLGLWSTCMCAGGVRVSTQARNFGVNVDLVEGELR